MAAEKKKAVEVEIAGELAAQVVERLKESDDFNLKRVLLVPILLVIAVATYFAYQFILMQNNAKLLDPELLNSLPDVQGLVEYGADANYNSPDTERPLIVASEFGSADVVGFLLANGADHTAMNFNGVTPLIGAVRAGKYDVMRQLISAGANVDQAGLIGTPLQVAVAAQDVDAIKLLLENDATVDKMDDYKYTALCRAAELGDLDIARLLIKHGADVNGLSPDTAPLLVATLKRTAAVALGGETQPPASTDPENEPGDDDGTATVEKEEPGHLEVIQLLLAHDADANIQSTNGRTALLYACATKDRKLITVLVDNGADINHQAAAGTPLLVATRAKDRSLIEFLISKGADVNRVGADKKSVLQSAVTGHDLDFVRFLISVGAGDQYLQGSAKELHGKKRVDAVLVALASEFPKGMNRMLNIEDGIEALEPVVTVNDSLKLNGTTQFVEVKETKTTLSTAKNVTVSIWVKRNKPGGVKESETVPEQYIVSRYGGVMLGFRLYIDENNRLTWAIYDGTLEYSVKTKARMLPDGRWMHVLATCGEGRMELFVNGHSVANAPAGAINSDGAGHLYVGRDSRVGRGYFAGEIQNVAVYPKVIYKEAFTPQLMPARIKSTYLLLNVDAGELRERFRTPFKAYR
jgi:ankyrin repeat protein